MIRLLLSFRRTNTFSSFQHSVPSFLPWVYYFVFKSGSREPLDGNLSLGFLPVQVSRPLICPFTPLYPSQLLPVSTFDSQVKLKSFSRKKFHYPIPRRSPRSHRYLGNTLILVFILLLKEKLFF